VTISENPWGLDDTRGEIIMGGYGSGRSGAGKTFVESCRILDINRLVRLGVVGPDHDSVGGLNWTSDGERVASLEEFSLIHEDLDGA
jgi:hypothetical protein